MGPIRTGMRCKLSMMQKSIDARKADDPTFPEDIRPKRHQREKDAGTTTAEDTGTLQMSWESLKGPVDPASTT